MTNKVRQSNIDPTGLGTSLPVGGTVGQVLVKNSNVDYDVSWKDPKTLSSLLDAARVNIASAATVDLTALLATTRNILITGVTTITGFQITAGQVFLVKFAAALTLRNNAAIVTGTGADIAVLANASCFIRATADNVVEVLSFVN